MPAQEILHIRRGRSRTTLQAKYNMRYGKINNIGAPQGSATSALLFVIYVQDMMEDFQATNYLEKYHIGPPTNENEKNKAN